MPINELISLAQALNVRTYAVRLAPAALTTLFVAALVWSGSREQEPNLDVLVERVQSFGVREAILFGVAFLAALLVETAIVRALMGSWGGGLVGLLLAVAGIHLQQWRRDHRYTWGVGFSRGPGRRLPRLSISRHKLDWKSDPRYSRSGFVGPTALATAWSGSVIDSGDKYGLTPAALPRLLPLLPEDQRTGISQASEIVLLHVRIVASAFVATVAALLLVGDDGWWLLLPLATLLLARSRYERSVLMATGVGALVEVAIDLHRFALHKAMHLPLSANSVVERAVNEKLCQFLERRDGDHEWVYSHPQPEREPLAG